MHIPVTSPEAIGQAVRQVRKRQGIRQEDLAAMVEASHVFLRDVEHGKPTVQLGRVLRVLEELGIRLYLDVPDDEVDAAPNVTESRT